MHAKPSAACTEPVFSKLSAGWTAYLPALAILAAVMLWGTSFAAMRITVRALSPAAVMWLRMVTALVVILPFSGRLIPAGYRSGDWKKLLPMVLFQPCLYFLLESNALRLTTSSQAGVVAASVPLLVAVGAFFFLKEQIAARTLAGLIVTIAGVLALTLLESPGARAENPAMGNLLELAAMACAAANILLVKQLSHRYNPWTLTAFQVAAGMLFFLPGLSTVWHAPATVWNLRLMGAILFLGVFVTLGAFGLYNWGMSRMPAANASVFINLVPVFAVLIGWTALGESLSAPQCLAALLVIGGVWWSQK